MSHLAQERAPVFRAGPVIDGGELGFQLVAVAVEHAADDGDLFDDAALFQAFQFEDHLDAFLDSGLEKAAGIDDDDLGFVGSCNEVKAGGCQDAAEALAVGGVLGTAEADNR